jgi:lipopolysaccharide biosynthesis glycosyltransferase
MNIVFCADHAVLPGLHVAAYSILDRISPSIEKTQFYVFSDTLDESDIALLHQTLSRIKKGFSLELRRINADQFKEYPPLNNGWAAYFRIDVPRLLAVDRFLYVDTDIVCDIDVSELLNFQMGDAPAALVPEASLSQAVDQYAARQLANSTAQYYLNSGVMLINRPEWIKQEISEMAMSYLKKHKVPYHDQSVLNIVFNGSARLLDERYNTISNMRKHWPKLIHPYGNIGCLVHLVDYPKPWNLGAEFIHPQYRLWRSVLEKTAMTDYRSWKNTPARNSLSISKAKQGYKKAIKDRILFKLHKNNIITEIKGVHKK